MLRRLVIGFVVLAVAQVGAFRYLHRDLFWIARPAASAAPADLTREAAEAALARPALSRWHAEAVIRATDRDGLRDLRLAALARLASTHPDDADLQLRYAEALRVAGQLEAAARVFARVAEAR